MFHKQKSPFNNLFIWKPGCSLPRLRRVCVRACVRACLFWRGTRLSLKLGRIFFFFSLDLAWFVFNKGQRSGLLWGEGKGHLR